MLFYFFQAGDAGPIRRWRKRWFGFGGNLGVGHIWEADMSGSHPIVGFQVYVHVRIRVCSNATHIDEVSGTVFGAGAGVGKECMHGSVATGNRSRFHGCGQRC